MSDKLFTVYLILGLITVFVGSMRLGMLVLHM